MVAADKAVATQRRRRLGDVTVLARHPLLAVLSASPECRCARPYEVSDHSAGYS